MKLSFSVKESGFLPNGRRQIIFYFQGCYIEIQPSPPYSSDLYHLYFEILQRQWQEPWQLAFRAKLCRTLCWTSEQNLLPRSTFPSAKLRFICASRYLSLSPQLSVGLYCFYKLIIVESFNIEKSMGILVLPREQQI